MNECSRAPSSFLCELMASQKGLSRQVAPCLQPQQLSWRGRVCSSYAVPSSSSYLLSLVLYLTTIHTSLSPICMTSPFLPIKLLWMHPDVARQTLLTCAGEETSPGK